MAAIPWRGVNVGTLFNHPILKPIIWATTSGIFGPVCDISNRFFGTLIEDLANDVVYVEVNTDNDATDCISNQLHGTPYVMDPTIGQDLNGKNTLLGFSTNLIKTGNTHRILKERNDLLLLLLGAGILGLMISLVGLLYYLLRRYGKKRHSNEPVSPIDIKVATDDRVKQLTKQVSSLEKENKTVKEEKDRMVKDAKDVLKRQDKATKKGIDAKTQLGEHEAALSRTQDLEKQLAEAKRDLTDVSGQLRKSRAEAANARTSLDAIKQETNDLEADVDPDKTIGILRTDNERLERKLRDMKIALQESRDSNASLNAVLLPSMEEIQRLKALEEQFKDTEANRSSTAGQMEKVQETLRKAEEQIEKLEKEKEKIKADLNWSEEAFSRKLKELEDVQKSKEVLTKHEHAENNYTRDSEDTQDDLYMQDVTLEIPGSVEARQNAGEVAIEEKSNDEDAQSKKASEKAKEAANSWLSVLTGKGDKSTDQAETAQKVKEQDIAQNIQDTQSKQVPHDDAEETHSTPLDSPPKSAPKGPNGEKSGPSVKCRTCGNVFQGGTWFLNVHSPQCLEWYDDVQKCKNEQSANEQYNLKDLENPPHQDEALEQKPAIPSTLGPKGNGPQKAYTPRPPRKGPKGLTIDPTLAASSPGPASSGISRSRYASPTHPPSSPQPTPRSGNLHRAATNPLTSPHPNPTSPSPYSPGTKLKPKELECRNCHFIFENTAWLHDVHFKECRKWEHGFRQHLKKHKTTAGYPPSPNQHLALRKNPRYEAVMGGDGTALRPSASPIVTSPPVAAFDHGLHSSQPQRASESTTEQNNDGKRPANKRGPSGIPQPRLMGGLAEKRSSPEREGERPRVKGWVVGGEVEGEGEGVQKEKEGEGGEDEEKGKEKEKENGVGKVGGKMRK